VKIAICIFQSDIGGVGTSTYILAKGFRRAGHEADILITDTSSGNDFQRALDDGWPVEAICAGERSLIRRLEKTRIILSKYDVVINNHSMETRLVLPTLPQKIIRISVIRSTTQVNIDNARQNSKYLDALIGISPEVTNLLKEINASCDVYTIPNAVLAESQALPILANPIQIIYVGRLEDKAKNVLILPEVINELKVIGINCMLTIVGDGPHRDELQKKIDEMNLNGSILVIGKVSRSKTLEMYKKAHFSLVPSNYEGFGLVVAESMASGVIPIVSDIPVFKWLIGVEGRTLLSPLKESRGYAEIIARITNNPNLYKELQVDLRTRQRTYFSPTSTVNSYLRLIDNLLGKHDPTRFSPIPFAKLPVAHHYWLRRYRFWLPTRIFLTKVIRALRIH